MDESPRPQRGYIYDGYADDLRLVWERAAKEVCDQIEAGRAPDAFSECVRYALIRLKHLPP